MFRQKHISPISLKYGLSLGLLLILMQGNGQGKLAFQPTFAAALLYLETAAI
jgi:hypothetical protein